MEQHVGLECEVKIENLVPKSSRLPKWLCRILNLHVSCIVLLLHDIKYVKNSKLLDTLSLSLSLSVSFSFLLPLSLWKKLSHGLVRQTNLTFIYASIYVIYEVKDSSRGCTHVGSPDPLEISPEVSVRAEKASTIGLQETPHCRPVLLSFLNLRMFTFL